jgi:superfamily I DNA/RNA helicase
MFAEILERDRIFLEGFNELVKEFFNVDYKPNKAIEKLPEFIEKVEDLKEGENQIQTVFETAKQTHLKKLNQVVEEINKIEGKQGKTRPLTTWKDKNLKKNKDNQFILADYEKLEKNLALVNFYEKYQEELHKQKLFDFEDMLLEVADKMKENPELCYNQREKYLYILVDEFQDTSGVQMRLLEGLIDMEISDGSPNLMVVGDDDQSVFKFQGASVQNILDFEKRYKNIKKVTLTKNYRSKQEILNFATNVIENCQTRLEGVNKVLESQV